MATFPSISPTYGIRKTSKPKIRTTNLGDGYEFRALFGLPLTQDPKIFDLTFEVSEELLSKMLLFCAMMLRKIMRTSSPNP